MYLSMFYQYCTISIDIISFIRYIDIIKGGDIMRLKEARKQARLTQKEVALAIGVNQNTYSYWENEKTKVDNVTLKKLSELFNVSVDYLLGSDSIPNLSNFSPLPPENKKIPIIGSVKCGPNGLAYQYLEGYVLVGEEFKGDIVAFRCTGDSMKDIGITDGDLAIVRLQEDVECGELAVVTINGDEGTLKRIRKFDNGIILEAANQEYPPRVFTGRELELIHIVGKVLEIRKKF